MIKSKNQLYGVSSTKLTKGLIVKEVTILGI